jgi:hypothetical protein
VPSQNDQRFVDKIGVGSMLKSILNMRNLDTIKEWGEELVRQHRPADLVALPDFMRPREPRKAAASASTLAAPVSSGSVAPVKQARTKDFSSATAAKPPEETAKRLICARCGVKISLPEGRYCWKNVKRFDGVTHCREHQALFFLRA